MYQPPHFQEIRLDVLHDLIRRHPLGLLVCNGESGPVANPIPFMLDVKSSPKGTLRAHLSRGNPQWKLLQAEAHSPALVVFQGADAYVTPSWYETKRQTGKVVPTWNYVMVQARGKVTVTDDASWLREHVSSLTDAHEAGRAEPWQASDAPEAYLAAQMRGIVGIQIEIAELYGKWKVSQNRPGEDRAGVAEGLAKGDDEASNAIAGLVIRYGEPDRP